MIAADPAPLKRMSGNGGLLTLAVKAHVWKCDSAVLDSRELRPTFSQYEPTCPVQ